jgi:hypothetical protein
VDGLTFKLFLIYSELIPRRLVDGQEARHRDGEHRPAPWRGAGRADLPGLGGRGDGLRGRGDLHRDRRAPDKKGVAEKLYVKQGSPKSVYDFIKDAHEAGVKFYCCSPNLDLFDMKQEDLIPECSGVIGGAHLIEEVMENDDVRVMTY